MDVFRVVASSGCATPLLTTRRVQVDVRGVLPLCKVGVLLLILSSYTELRLGIDFRSG